MNYTQALEYIHLVNWTFCKPGLSRIAALCEALGNPQEGLSFIHVAGTNGKGSFCAMTESVLRRAGYKTGLFTSPYIRTFTERMAVDGVPISEEELAQLTTLVQPIVDAMEDKPTEFELITALAFLYFRRHGCQVVVLETGMGGRLDSTNIISAPLLTVITGVALDHTAFLGDTVEAIAAEKAGIIKGGCPVLYGGRDIAAREVIAHTAAEKGVPLYGVDPGALVCREMTLAGSLLDYKEWKEIRLSLLGGYQPHNAAVVLEAVELLRQRGLTIPAEAVYEGLKAVRWPGRFELVSRQPVVIFDGAHNAQGVTAAVESVRQYFGDQRVCVFTGVLKDKDYAAIADQIARVAGRAFVITPDNPRALQAEIYAQLLTNRGVPATAYEDIAAGYAAAKEAAALAGCPLLCLGSLYVYASLWEKEWKQNDQ